MTKFKTFLACAILLVTAAFTSSSLTAAGCGGGSCAYGPYAGNRTGWGTNQVYMPSGSCSNGQCDGNYYNDGYASSYNYGSSYSYPSYNYGSSYSYPSYNYGSSYGYDGSYSRGMNYSYPSYGSSYGYGYGFRR